jgi:hypothetical protein
MKSLLALIFLSLVFCLKSYAIKTHLPSLSQSDCSVRLSNDKIQKQFNINGAELGYCSGTFVAPNLIVTAAHCLNEAVPASIADLKEMKSISLNIAFKTEESSASYETQQGPSAVVYSSQMATDKQRSDFITQGDVAKLSQDLVILKLKNPVSGKATEFCPHLPTAVECSAFAVYTANANKDLSLVAANFYSSNYYESDSGMIKKKYSYPSNRSVKLGATYLDENKEQKFLVLQFNTQEQAAELEKGDSGTGLLWQRPDGKKVLIGVQSATSAKNRNSAYFANICAFVENPNWP